MPQSSIQDLLPPWARRLRPYLHGKPIEEIERELGRSTVRLAANENPLGPSPHVLEAIRQSLSLLHRFPESSGYYLRQKLAAVHGLDMNQFVLGAGATDLIALTARAFLAAGDEAITCESTFHVFRLAVEAVGAVPVFTPLREMCFDLAAIAQAVTQRTKLIYLANPNNPTGTHFTAHELSRFLASLAPRLLVILDEAYYEYVQRADYSRSVEEVRAGKNLLVLRTFSKVYGLAGMRLGYGMGYPQLVEVLNRVRLPFNVSSLAQAAGLAALDDREHVARSVASNTEEMRFLTEELTLLGVRYTPSVANFLLLDTGRDCEEDFLRLLHQGVLVRPMKYYGLPTCLRVTVSTHEDNQRFLETLQQVTKSAGRLSA